MKRLSEPRASDEALVRALFTQLEPQRLDIRQSHARFQADRLQSDPEKPPVRQPVSTPQPMYQLIRVTWNVTCFYCTQQCLYDQRTVPKAEFISLSNVIHDDSRRLSFQDHDVTLIPSSLSTSKHTPFWTLCMAVGIDSSSLMGCSQRAF